MVIGVIRMIIIITNQPLRLQPTLEIIGYLSPLGPGGPEKKFMWILPMVHWCMIMMKWDDFNLNDFTYTPPLGFLIHHLYIFFRHVSNPNNTFPVRINGLDAQYGWCQILLTRKLVVELRELESSWMPHWAVVVWALGFTPPKP